MPYQVESSAKLENDARLKSDGTLVKKLAQGIARVLKELGDVGCNTLTVHAPDTASVIESIRSSNFQDAKREDLIAVVRAIEEKFKDRIIGQPAAGQSDERKVEDVRALCGSAAVQIQGKILSDDDLISRVFGSEHLATARAVLREAIANLEKFARADNGWNLVYDETLKAAGMAATGSLKQIKFCDSLLTERAAGAHTMLLHESTHTIESRVLMTRDHIYRNHPGFVSAPADIKLKNAAHYEELGWQALQGEEKRAFLPQKDVKAIVTMIVTNAWIMSGWLLNTIKLADEHAKVGNNAHVRQNISRMLGLSVHKKPPKSTTLGSFFDSVVAGFTGPNCGELSAVDEMTLIQRQVSLNKCLSSLKEGVLERYEPSGTTPEELIDDTLRELIERQDDRLRKSTPKSVLMIKSLAAAYLINVGHFKQDDSEPAMGDDHHLHLLGNTYDPGAPNANMERFAHLLNGHVKRVAAL